jgi:hypothetical protein
VKRAEGCPSDLELERALMGEAVPAAAHLTGCPHCAPRVEWMKQVGQCFATSVFPRLREGVAEAATRPRFEWPWRLTAVLVPLAAAAVLFVVYPRTPGRDYVGDKGGPGSSTLEVYLGEGSQGRRIGNGERVHPGDGLRFVVSSAQPRGFLFTVDSTGRVSRLYPNEGLRPAPLDGLLPNGAILDDVPGPERVFAVFPTRAMEFPEVEAAVAAAFRGPQSLRDTDRLPLNVPQASVLLEKEPR